MVESKRPVDVFVDVLIHVVIVIACFLCLIPLLNTLALSFSSSVMASSGTVSFWPKQFTLAAYEAIVGEKQFFGAFWISIKRVVLGGTINFLMMVLCAFPLAHSEKAFRGRNVYMYFLIFTMLFSGGLVPTYIIVGKMGLMNTLWALILPGSYSIWYIILVRSYFRTIPESLRESAKLDGANSYRILWNVFLPTSKPILAVIALYTIIGVWNSWYHASIYITDHDWQPLQLYLRRILIEQTEQLGDMMDDAEAMRRAQQQQISNNQMKYTVIIVSSLPMLIAYPFFQQYVVKGVMLGSLKE